MSFRAKAIAIVTVLSVAPYIITVLLLGNVYRNEMRARIFEDLEYQLQNVASQIDSQLEVLEKDMRFMSTLDVMNDVLSRDLDKRITEVLIAKKSDLKLDGDFFVLDETREVIASSSVQAIGEQYAGNVFYEVPVMSSLTGSAVGALVVDYDLSTLQRTLPVSQHQQYSLAPEDSRDLETASDDLSAQVTLNRRPDLVLQLTRSQDFAFALLDNLQRFFFVGLIIGIGVIGFVAYLIANYLVNPILVLSRTAELITRTEDYSQRVDIERNDEIGTLAKTFNMMLAGMERLVARVQEEGENKLKLVQEKNRAEMLQSLSTKLSKYLSPQVYESIFSGEKDVTLSSSRKKLTIFFSDIVNFTDTTDQMESEDLTSLLNEYLSEMTDIALRYGATIDKYIGDAVMIFFGDPKSHGVTEDAVLCIQMAVAMQSRMAELREHWRRQGFTRPLSIRVGIHTGYCTVGNFGTESRMDYTILGSPVNLASRIESSAEPGTVYISEETYLLVKDQIRCVAARTITPKGFSKEVQLYRVLVDQDEGQITTLEAPGVSLTIDPSQIDKQAIADLRDKLSKLL
ncbi:MAG: HAMP domain-containing protein [Proteobacteria bacterium]|nr:HAMP domain-containing protein [Pseudomonadota bacterium]